MLAAHTTTNALINALNDITANDVIDAIVEGAYSLGDLIRGLASANYGKVSGGGTSNLKFRNLADTKNRINETVDSTGRTSVTLDLAE